LYISRIISPNWEVCEVAQTQIGLFEVVTLLKAGDKKVITVPMVQQIGHEGCLTGETSDDHRTEGRVEDLAMGDVTRVLFIARCEKITRANSAENKEWEPRICRFQI